MAARYANKVDVNHAEIRDALRDIPGVTVQDVASCGGLGFDLIARYQNRPPVFLEIKADATKKLTVSESAAKKMYGYYWWRIETLDDALTALGCTRRVRRFEGNNG